MPYDFKLIQNTVIEVAREELLPRFAKVEREQKTDGSIVTQADMAVQARLKHELIRLCPGSDFLAEEMTDQEKKDIFNSNKPLWVLDPLDGTSNFAAGIPYFSVSLVLLKNRNVQYAQVYDPSRDECFMATGNEPATLNGELLGLSDCGLDLGQSIGIIDFKRLDVALSQRLVADIPYASQRSFGSVALDWCWLAAGRGHLYLHGRSNIWDYAAGNFIFGKAGGFSATLDGEPVFSDSLSPRSSVAAVDRKLFSQWCNWLGVTVNSSVKSGR